MIKDKVVYVCEGIDDIDEALYKTKTVAKC